jgi:uncharacterized protein
MNNEDTASVTALARSSVAEKTFIRLRSLYDQEGGEPGTLLKIGLKPGWTVVIGSKRECGTAFRFSGPHKVYDGHHVTPEIMKALIGRSLMDMVEENLISPLIPLRSIAIAALSALSQTFLTEEALARRGLFVKADRDVLESLVRHDDVVTLVGYGGMVENLVGKCRELHVTDMRSPDSLLTTIIGEGIEFAPATIILHGADEDEDILGKSDVVIITASSLVNGTIDELLRYSSNARVVGLYGPSASVIPDVLFEAGVDFVMSHHVRDPEIFVSDLTSDMNMESAIRKHQRYQTIVPERFKVQNGETAT